MGKIVRGLLGVVILYSVAGANVALAEQSIQTAQALHERLLKESASDPYVIIPYLGAGEMKGKLARSLLDGLWSTKSYRDHLVTWLARRPAGSDD